MKVKAERLIDFVMSDGADGEVVIRERCIVADVTQPLISLGRLLKRGWFPARDSGSLWLHHEGSGTSVPMGFKGMSLSMQATIRRVDADECPEQSSPVCADAIKVQSSPVCADAIKVQSSPVCADAIKVQSSPVCADAIKVQSSPVCADAVKVQSSPVCADAVKVQSSPVCADAVKSPKQSRVCRCSQSPKQSRVCRCSQSPKQSCRAYVAGVTHPGPCQC